MPTMPKTPDAEPDLVDRIFEYLLAEFPLLNDPRIEQAKRAVRSEFSGERTRVGTQSPRERAELSKSVLSHFNGRNASEVARRLGISRATVYRLIKQAGLKDRLSFAQLETGGALRSSLATSAQPENATWPSPQINLLPSTLPSQAASCASASTGETSRTAA